MMSIDRSGPRRTEPVLPYNICMPVAAKRETGRLRPSESQPRRESLKWIRGLLGVGRKKERCVLKAVG